MTNSGTKVVFFGTEDFSLSTLTALVEDGYDVALVITKPDSPRGRGHRVSEPAVKSYAAQRGIRVVQPEHLGDITAAIEAVTDRIGVLSSYGKIIPAATLDLFERGIVNVHPSLLPRYRGPSPIETAVMNGDPSTGVSIMRLVSAMDAGPVYVQTDIGLSAETTAAELYATCARTGSELLLEALPRIIDGTLVPDAQDETAATYTRLLTKDDARVDPATMSASTIDRHVRAYGIYPRTRIKLAGYDVIITRTHLGEPAGGISVECYDGSRITIDELIAPSGKKVTGADFRRGYGKRG